MNDAPRPKNITRQTTAERQPNGKYDVVVRYVAGDPLRYEGKRVITSGGVLSEHRPYRGVGPKQAERLAAEIQSLLEAAWLSGIDHERRYPDSYGGCNNR